MITDYSNSYKIAKVLYIDEQLANLPNAHRVRGRRSVRIYNSDHKILHTYNLDKPGNHIYGEIADKRAHLKRIRKRLLSDLNISPSEFHIELSAGYRLRKEDWEKMRSQSNSKEIKTDLWFNGIQMRSRFEVNTAILLSGLDLEFKYEPELIVNGRTIHPDFVVYLPEFEVCFIIECMGKAGDPQYGYDASERIKILTEGGFIPFRDYLVLGGSDSYIPTKEWVTNAIVSIVNLIAGECVLPKSQEIRRQPEDLLLNEIPQDLLDLINKDWEF